MIIYEEEFYKAAKKRLSEFQNKGFKCSLKLVVDLNDETFCSFDAESADIIFKIVVWNSGEIGVDVVYLASEACIILNPPNIEFAFKEKVDFYFEQLSRLPLQNVADEDAE